MTTILIASENAGLISFYEGYTDATLVDKVQRMLDLQVSMKVILTQLWLIRCSRILCGIFNGKKVCLMVWELQQCV